MIHHLADNVKFINGIGPKRAEALYEIGIESGWDLLNYFPRRYLDRTNISAIRDLRLGESATVVGRVENFTLVRNRKAYGSRFRLILADDTGHIHLVWFQGAQYYEKAFERGETLAVYGRVDFYNGERQITHPEFDRLTGDEDENFLHTGGIIPVYPTTEVLRRRWFDSRGFRKIIKAIMPLTEQIAETMPPEIRQSQRLIDLGTAYRQIHFPLSPDNLKAASDRLKFDELFYLQLMMAIRKKKLTLEKRGVTYDRVGETAKALIARLPFQLTESQKQVLRDIRADMKSPVPMNRLLQGDVGSGKTIVALLSLLMAVENGYQTAFVAPTEILAEQHYFVLQECLWGMNVPVVLLKGGQKKSEREKTLAAIRDHQADIVVGTHAVFQESVAFDKLGFIVIDEQHRFGVMQRAEIRQKALEKNINPDVLVMTATPIPRTLAMSVYGDLDISVITELPTGRKPIKTVVRTEEARTKIYDFFREQVKAGRQCYIVYPLIEESEKVDLKAATEAYEHLSKDVFAGLRLGLLHGRMKSPEKQETMALFKNHRLDILVSTTVVEVGVNVPNASVMMIEHAERFGLTQLHQLRGRVGRGAEQSYCILMTEHQFMGGDTERRLRIMEETTDGFRISEEDLLIRGPGEFFGTKQSGMPELKLAHLVQDRDILQKARHAAFELIENDPHLRKPPHEAIRKQFLQAYSEKLSLGDVG